MKGSAANRDVFGPVWLLLLSLSLLVSTSCEHRNSLTPTSMPPRDINDVLRDHDQELLSIPGVVGVFVGLMPDQKTACLKIMTATNAAAIKRRVPRTIEGYNVVIEETGVIRPLSGEK